MHLLFKKGGFHKRSRHFDFMSDHQFICKFLLRESIEKLAPCLESSILDVGCGSRPYDEHFVHLKKVSCDLDQRRRNLDVICMATPLPFADSSFSSILCTEVLEHVSDPHQVMKDFKRILRPRGRILLSVPAWWPPHELPFDFYRYPERGFKFLVESNGFRILHFKPRGGLYALLGQIVILMMPQYFPFSFQRSSWNYFWLKMDSWRQNFRVSLGWTCLAEKVF